MPQARSRTLLRGLPPLLVVLIGAGGCALHSKPEAPPVMARTAVTAPVDELRQAVVGRSQRAADEIERAADSIASVTTTPAVRINAIEWKLVSATSIQSAALARDPAIALADLVIFCLQMQDFLTTGAGRDLFGPEQPVAIAAADRNLARMLRLVDEVSPPGTSARWLTVLRPLATANPIQSPMVGRASVTDTIINQLSTDRSALAAVGDIELSVRLVDYRIEQIQRNMLKQARWQAELLLADAAKQPAVDSLLAALTSVTGSVDRIAGVAEGVPWLVRSERLAVLAAVTAEREALLQALSAERDSIFALITAERMATMVEGEVALQRLVDHALDRTLSDVLDRLLLRVFAGLLILGLLGFAMGLMLARAFRAPALDRQGHESPTGGRT